MEKEGLCRVMKYLKQQKVAIEIIVTDRHKQINKWLRETHPNIQHFYDVWYVVKGKGYNNIIIIYRCMVGVVCIACPCS